VNKTTLKNKIKKMLAIYFVRDIINIVIKKVFNR